MRKTSIKFIVICFEKYYRSFFFKLNVIFFFFEEKSVLSKNRSSEIDDKVHNHFHNLYPVCYLIFTRYHISRKNLILINERAFF